MPRIDVEELRDPEQVFIAGTLRLARRAEDSLTNAGVDYGVKVEEYARSFLFGTPRMGAVFYVGAAQAEHCRQRLTDAGLGAGVVEGQEEVPPR
jgi:hypothetical protein